MNRTPVSLFRAPSGEHLGGEHRAQGVAGAWRSAPVGRNQGTCAGNQKKLKDSQEGGKITTFFLGGEAKGTREKPSGQNPGKVIERRKGKPKGNQRNSQGEPKGNHWKPKRKPEAAKKERKENQLKDNQLKDEENQWRSRRREPNKRMFEVA